MRVMNEAVKGEIHGSDLIFVEPEGNLSDALFSSRVLGGEQNPAAMMLN